MCPILKGIEIIQQVQHYHPVTRNYIDRTVILGFGIRVLAEEGAAVKREWLRIRISKFWAIEGELNTIFNISFSLNIDKCFVQYMGFYGLFKVVFSM